MSFYHFHFIPAETEMDVLSRSTQIPKLTPLTSSVCKMLRHEEGEVNRLKQILESSDSESFLT
jgi:hypothetical protein